MRALHVQIPHIIVTAIRICGAEKWCSRLTVWLVYGSTGHTQQMTTSRGICKLQPFMCRC